MTSAAGTTVGRRRLFAAVFRWNWSSATRPAPYIGPNNRLSGGELALDASYLVVHALLAVHARAEAQGAGNSRDAHLVQHLVAALHGRENVVPFAFDIRTVGVQMHIESGLAEHTLTGGDLLRHGNADAKGHNAEIGDNLHAQTT